MAEAGGKLSAFLRRHRRFATFAGAVIVFLTFVMKEGIRDHYKDLAGAVESAESLFIVCDTIRVPPNVSGTISTAVKAKLAQEQIDEIITVMRQEETYIESTLSTSKRLLEKLPGQEERLARLEKLQMQVSSEVINERAQHAIDLDESVLRLYRHLNKKRKQESIIGADVAGMVWKFFPLQLETQKLADESLAIAENVKREAEWRYRIATRASYVFYMLGWALALVGRIYGFEGNGVGE